MNWQELIPLLLNQFRVSTYTLEQKGVSSAVLSNIKTGKTKKPSGYTVKKLEDALNIQIDDTDPNNLTYRVIENEADTTRLLGGAFHRYTLVKTIISRKELEEIEAQALPNVDSAFFDYDTKDGCYAYQATNDFIPNEIVKGDVMLIDTAAELSLNHVCVCMTKTGDVLIGKYQPIDEDFRFLISSGKPGEPPRVLTRAEVKFLFRVVRIYRKL